MIMIINLKYKNYLLTNVSELSNSFLLRVHSYLRKQEILQIENNYFIFENRKFFVVANDITIVILRYDATINN